MHAPFNLIKNISPRRPTRGTTNLALQFPSCPLDATSTLRDGAHSISVTTACSYSEFSCSYSFQLPRASVPPPHGRGGGCGAPVWSPGHIVPRGGAPTTCPMGQGLLVKPQKLTERSSCFRSWSDTKLLLGCTLRFWSLGILDQALTSKVSKLPEARLRICRCYII